MDQNHPEMLFNRRDDPLELNNLIDNPYYKQRRRKELEQFLVEWESRTPNDGKKVVAASSKKK